MLAVIIQISAHLPITPISTNEPTCDLYNSFLVLAFISISQKTITSFMGEHYSGEGHGGRNLEEKGGKFTGGDKIERGSGIPKVARTRRKRKLSVHLYC